MNRGGFHQGAKGGRVAMMRAPQGAQHLRSGLRRVLRAVQAAVEQIQLELLDHGLEQFELVVEVHVEGSGGPIRRARDLRDLGLEVARVGEHPARGIEQGGAGASGAVESARDAVLGHPHRRPAIDIEFIFNLNPSRTRPDGQRYLHD